MSKHDRLNILVLSDLHAHSGDPNSSASPSHLSTNSLYSDPMSNPLADVVGLLEAKGLSADWVMTPGDLGDRADPVAQKFAWAELDAIKTRVGAQYLFGTAGNHDLDSRRNFPDHDPKSALQLLNPTFPLACDLFEMQDGVYSDRYWSRNFVIVPFDDFDCTLLILNSSAFHGYSSDATTPPNEHLRGKISPLTLDAIRAGLASRKTKLNIVLVHHHLVRHPWIDDAGSHMIGGDKLIEALKQTGRQWLVIHGHQHVPGLSYADSSSIAPVVLSAGSVAAKTYMVRGVHSRNQVHHVSIDLGAMDPSGAELLGSITTWTWALGTGWREATADGGLPNECGFGYRPAALDMRNRLIAATKANPNKVLRWSEAVAIEPKLKYLVPEDLKHVLSLIENSGAVVDRDRYDMPRQLECQ